jgi:hypothetical protein
MAAATATVSAMAASVAPEANAIRRIGFPYEGYCFVFDTETTTDISQEFRIGSYAVYGISEEKRIELCRRGQLTRAELDQCAERGLFYDDAQLSSEEVLKVAAYGKTNGMEVHSVGEFVKKILYRWIYWERALCIGHNLPFDLSRLAVDWGPGIKQFKNGFWLSLCGCTHGRDCFYHPSIRVKMLGSKKASFAFAANRPPRGKPKHYRGRFLDTATFGLALLGPGDPSLAGMGRRFNSRVRKQTSPAEHGGEINDEYLNYLANDVEATWALFQEERSLYARHQVSQPMWKIFSEASLGKAYLRDMGVPRFMDQHPDLPRPVLGVFMQTYYGGRAEVRIRLQPTEVIVADFKSQYPTVNALMDLQSLLLAKTIEIKHCPEQVRDWLTSLTVDDLQRPETWKRFRCIVQIKPNADILPVRTNYGDDSTALNTGLNHVTSPIPTWYALADVVGSWLLTGRVPEILDAIELVPHGRVETIAKALFGDKRYQIDLACDDLFTRVINLRTDIKNELKSSGLTAERREYLEALQLGLKLLANSTAYGALVEINTATDLHQKQRVKVHAGTTPLDTRSAIRIQWPLHGLTAWTGRHSSGVCPRYSRGLRRYLHIRTEPHF